MIRLYSLVFLLHAYVGWRLLPDLPPGAAGAGVLLAWLIFSAAVLPMGLSARRFLRQPYADRLVWAGMIAMGSFSSLFVLTFLRDAGLLLVSALAWMLRSGISLYPLQSWSAAAVPLLAALFTFLGFVNARRTAAVRIVEVAIDGLPPALHGLSIAQISDLPIGPTIKRSTVERIVESVNRLEADLIAVTGDLVDGSVAQLFPHTAPLAHQPRSAIAAETAGYHLQLSGHTHGGQFWPWNHFVRLQQPFTAGLRLHGALQVYVSRGTGYWGPPKRLLAPSEITLLRMVLAPRAGPPDIFSARS